MPPAHSRPAPQTRACECRVFRSAEQDFTGANTVRDAALGCASWHELFGVAGGSSAPFGLVLKTLHHPAWYDEPKDASRHLLSRNLSDLGVLSRPGSFSRNGDFAFHTRRLATRIIPGEEVLSTAEELLGR